MIFTGEYNLFGFVKSFLGFGANEGVREVTRMTNDGGSTFIEPTFGILPTNNGRFAIVDFDRNEVINTYTRRRDAVRGAQRRGLTNVIV